jgi:tryptophanyl-tRNA synthetase
MSASIDSSAIFMKDSPKQIKDKINRYAFSGGQTSAEEQREKGGNPDVDVSYQYLTFFMEDDEVSNRTFWLAGHSRLTMRQELARIGEEYRQGKLLTGEVSDAFPSRSKLLN